MKCCILMTFNDLGQNSGQDVSLEHINKVNCKLHLISLKMTILCLEKSKKWQNMLGQFSDEQSPLHVSKCSTF